MNETRLMALGCAVILILQAVALHWVHAEDDRVPHKYVVTYREGKKDQAVLALKIRELRVVYVGANVRFIIIETFRELHDVQRQFRFHAAIEKVESDLVLKPKIIYPNKKPERLDIKPLIFKPVDQLPRVVCPVPYPVPIPEGCKRP